MPQCQRRLNLSRQAGYNEKTDIWSFGVMAYALLFNEFPYAPQQRDKETEIAQSEC